MKPFEIQTTTKLVVLCAWKFSRMHLILTATISLSHSNNAKDGSTDWQKIREERKKIDMRWQPSFMLYIQPAKGNPIAIVFFFFCSFAYSLWSTQAIGLLVGLQPAYKSSGAVKWKSWIVSLYVNAVGAITFTICNRSTSASFVYLHQRQRQFFNAAAALLSLSPSTDKLVAAGTAAWKRKPSIAFIRYAWLIINCNYLSFAIGDNGQLTSQSCVGTRVKLIHIFRYEMQMSAISATLLKTFEE